MIKVYSDVIQFRGNHFDFGMMQGELLKNSTLLHNWTKRFKKGHDRHFLIDLAHFERVMKEFSPAILQEIYGLAHALDYTLEDTIRYFGGYYVEFGKSGCSIFTGDHYMIRNYDNDPFSYDGRFVLFEPTDQAYASIGPTMQITGRTDGMNEKGLTMGYNFINRKQSDDGFMCNMIGRILLENCANVDEAVDLLREIPYRHSFSYVLTDSTGKSIIVEASPREVVTRVGNMCTNHFDILTDENRYRMDDSLRRQTVMQAEQTHLVDSLEAYRMMNDSHIGVFSDNYGAWSGTIHTALFYPEKLKVGLSLGGDRLPYMFDFDKWLAGENINVKKLNGQLDSNIPFGNMKK